MKILTAEFLGSYTETLQYPKERLPEIAFVGRSNVGKSSLINCLVNRKRLAKVSTTPGKTRTVNFFRVGLEDQVFSHVFFVDLPGYGYAKVARSLREQWGPMIEEYLSQAGQLFAVVQLVDMRVLQDQDLQTHQWLKAIGQDPILVGTKVDKLSRNDRSRAKMNLAKAFSCPQENFHLSSAKTQEGRIDIWKAIRRRYEIWMETRVTI